MPRESRIAWIPVTVDHVVIYHSACLHVGVAAGRTDEFEAAAVQLLAHGLCFRCLRGDIRQTLPVIDKRLAVHEAPDIGVKAAKFRLHGQELARILEAIGDKVGEPAD